MQGNRKARGGGGGPTSAPGAIRQYHCRGRELLHEALVMDEYQHWSMIQNKPISRWIYQILCFDKENCKARGGWESNYQHVASQPFVLRPNELRCRADSGQKLFPVATHERRAVQGAGQCHIFKKARQLTGKTSCIVLQLNEGRQQPNSLPRGRANCAMARKKHGRHQRRKQCAVAQRFSEAAQVQLG